MKNMIEILNCLLDVSAFDGRTLSLRGNDNVVVIVLTVDSNGVHKT